MRQKSGTTHEMQAIFVFVLLGLFAVMSTLLVLLGAQMYRGTVEHSEATGETRILSSYVRSMVRAHDAQDAIGIEQHGDITALALREQWGSDTYVTWLYEYEGNLYEQFTDAGREFVPASGDVICPAGSFVPSLSDGLLTLQMTEPSGEDCTVQIALHCGGEENG